MSKEQKLKNVAVVLKGTSPSEDELAVIKELKKRAHNVLLLNGVFMRCTSSERVRCSRLMNLSGREDVDEFYKDILIHADVAKESEEKANDVQAKEKPQEAKAEKEKSSPKAEVTKPAAKKTTKKNTKKSSTK